MSFAAAAWAIDQKPKSPYEKLVLIVLADCHNKDTGRCDPSIPFLAEKSLCTQRTVMRCIESLAAQNFIFVIRREGIRNKYKLNMDGEGCQKVTGDTESRVPVTQSHGRGDTESLDQCRESHPNQEVTSNQPVSKPLATTTENFSPDERLKQQLATIGLTYSETDLIEYQIYLDAKIEKDHVINPRNSFLKWLKVRHVEADNQKHRNEAKQKKSNLYDLGDRELMKLCETHGIGTHGKTTKELVEKLRAVV